MKSIHYSAWVWDEETGWIWRELTEEERTSIFGGIEMTEVIDMLRIYIPGLPPPQLSPNYNRRGSHWRKSKAYQEWRDLVYYCAVSARNKAGLAQPFEKATLKWVFYYPVKRNRDTDNLISTMKPAQDALIRAGIIQADDISHLTLDTPIVIISREEAPLTIGEVRNEANTLA